MGDVKVNEIKTDAIKNQAGTSAMTIDSNGITEMHAGSIIQMAGDTYNPGTTLDISTATVNAGSLGSNLQVQLNFRSTSNKFYVRCFIPDLYDNGTRTRALHGGFRYSNDAFSSHSATLGDREFISDHMGYVGTGGPAVLMGQHYETFGSVPETGTLTIRPFLKAINGTFRVNANSIGVFCLTVTEIKG